MTPERWFLKLDIRHFFETADHAVLRTLIRRLIKDPEVIHLVDLFVEHSPHGPGFRKGLAIGNLTSQHFANLYLGPLDHFVLEQLRPEGYVRYMDDIVVLNASRGALLEMKAAIHEFVVERLLLEVKEEATQVNRCLNGVPFLGFRIWPSQIRLDGARKRRFKRRVALLNRLLRDGGMSEEEYSSRISSVSAWAQQANTQGLRVSSFWLPGWDE